MGVKEVTSHEEFKRIINSDKVSVFDFWATWCGPCRVISPVFVQFSDKIEEIDFYKVDVDEQGDISEEVGVRAMPTFMAFKNGEKIGEVVGANPTALNDMLKKFATVKDADA